MAKVSSRQWSSITELFYAGVSFVVHAYTRIIYVPLMRRSQNKNIYPPNVVAPFVIAYIEHCNVIGVSYGMFLHFGGSSIRISFQKSVQNSHCLRFGQYQENISPFHFWVSPKSNVPNKMCNFLIWGSGHIYHCSMTEKNCIYGRFITSFTFRITYSIDKHTAKIFKVLLN